MEGRIGDKRDAVETDWRKHGRMQEIDWRKYGRMHQRQI